MEDPPVVEKKDSVKQETEQSKPSNYASYLSVVYWSDYFDVTQVEIMERLVNVLNPQKMNLGSIIKTKPELYGPFWITSTIIFCIFAFGNLSRLIVGHDYNYEFISSACSLMYGFLNQVHGHSALVDVLRHEIPKHRRTNVLCELNS